MNTKSLVTTKKLGRDRKHLEYQETMSQDQNEAAIRNQVKWRQDSVATDFPGHNRNANNTRNIVATRTNRNVVAT